MKNRLKSFLLLLSLLLVTDGHSSEIAISLGGQGRYLLSHSSDKDLESHKKGYFAAGTVALHWMSQDVMYHLGGSWGFFELEGEKATGSPPPRNRGYFNGRLASSSLAVQFSNSGDFYFGPQATVFFGQDSSFSPTRDGQSDLPRVLFGLVGTQKIDFSYHHLFLDFVAETDVNIHGRQIYSFGVNLRIVFPISRSSTEIRTVHLERKITVPVYKTKVIERKESFTAYPLAVAFHGKTLTRNSRRYLSYLARFLQRNQNAFRSIEVHQSAREQNWGKGKRIISYLIAGGFPSEKISLHQSQKGKKWRAAFYLLFKELRSQHAFIKALSRIQQKTLTPETCVGENCR